jgi:hypothetical protein
MTPRVSVAQRRARLVALHGLGVPAATVGEAADAMIALHATDPVTMYLSAWARTRAAVVACSQERAELGISAVPRRGRSPCR